MSTIWGLRHRLITFLFKFFSFGLWSGVFGGLCFRYQHKRRMTWAVWLHSTHHTHTHTSERRVNWEQLCERERKESSTHSRGICICVSVSVSCQAFRVYLLARYSYSFDFLFLSTRPTLLLSPALFWLCLCLCLTPIFLLLCFPRLLRISGRRVGNSYWARGSQGNVPQHRSDTNVSQR